MQKVTSNGAEIPALGFGTFRIADADVRRILPLALELGFRHVDTAQIYDNESGVGAGIAASGVPRGDIFLTTKVWPVNFAPKDFVRSVEESLSKLRTDYVDLLLLHWPGGSDVPREDQIGELNRVRDRGLTRHIGISNYSIAEMEKAVALSATPLATNQVEFHPYLDQSRLLAAARVQGLSLTGYFVMADGRVPKDPLLAEIGARYGKTAAQVALRWAVQHEDVVALTKTAKAERLEENFRIFDFDLTDEEMAAIAALAEPGGRIVNPKTLAPPHWD